jgi:hypothetical protein
MATKKYKCDKCSRSFAMPAHLARHQKSIHASPAQRRAKQASASGRKPGRPRNVPVGNNGVGRLLSDMQAYRSELADRQNALQQELDSITQAINALGGSAARVSQPSAARPGKKRGPGRPKSDGPRPGSLGDCILKVLHSASSPMGPNQIAKSVVRSGYKSKARDLAKAVSNALPTLKGVKKISTGRYGC